MKKLKKVLCILFCVVFITSCHSKTNITNIYEKYQADYFDIFDTHTRIIIYAKSKSEFQEYADIIYNRLLELHQYFDIYNEYDDFNNLKTINDNAGYSPVKISDEILDLIKFSKEAYYITQGTVNIALGSVLSLWHEYRKQGLLYPNTAEIPPMNKLIQAKKYTDIEKIIIDEKEKTIFLTEKEMSLDVGALAKGFAVKLVIDEAQENGIDSCLLNVGGNIAILGKPLDNTREKWSLGIQDPFDENSLLDTIYANDASVVTSGDYQRYYIVDSLKYNHIIDPKTLMPAVKFKAVTVLHENSVFADLLSTALFILSYEEGFKLAEDYGASVIWVNTDGTIFTNEKYNEISKMFGDY